jgi:hypothetical protein
MKLTRASLAHAGAQARQRKARARILLEARDLPGLLNWAREDRNVMRSLMSFLYDNDEMILWRAVEGLAAVAAAEAADDMESVRRILRRLFWSMNDESGSVGWHAPEAIGEILRNVPALIAEYGQILGSFLREKPFERGVHYSVSRLAPLKPDLFAGLKTELARSLTDPDQSVRAYAILALAEIDFKSFIPQFKRLLGDNAAFSAFDWDTGTLKIVTVAEIATDCLRRHPQAGNV